MKIKYKYFYFFTLIFILTGCERVSEDAKNAGFKSDEEFNLHLQNLKNERDRKLKEQILVVSNLDSFVTFESYSDSLEKLSLDRRRYISEGGDDYNLLYASKALSERNEEISGYIDGRLKSYKDAYECISELDEPKDEDSYGYSLLKTLYDMEVSLCKINNTQYLEYDYTSASTAARKLANSEKKAINIEEAEIMFNIYFKEALLEEWGNWLWKAEYITNQ